MTEYTEAREVERMARKIIQYDYDELSSRPFVFLFENQYDKDGVIKIPERKGKLVYGTVKVVSGLNAYLSAKRVGRDYDDPPEGYFVVILTERLWQRLNDEQRRPLLDSLLARCAYDSEKNKLSLADPDVTEFHGVVKRHGAWNAALEIMQSNLLDRGTRAATADYDSSEVTH